MEMKDSYLAAMDARLAEWRDEFDRLTLKAERAAAGQRKAHRAELEALRDRLRALEEKLEVLRAMRTDTWEESRADVDRAWTELKEAGLCAVCRVR